MRLQSIRIRSGVAAIFALSRDGECPTLDFLSKLKRDGSPDIGRLTRLLDETAATGPLKNLEKFKPIGDGLYEFRAWSGARLLCFMDTGRIVLCTNGYVKKKDKLDPAVIAEAARWKRDYFAAKEAKTLEIVSDE